MNGMLLRGESKAQLARRRDPGVAYFRTKPKQGAVGFAGIEVRSLSGGFLVCVNAMFDASLDNNLND